MVAVAAPVEGKFREPRKMPVPLTSSLAAGAVLPIPTLVPLSKIRELAISADASNLASLFTVPPAVVTAVLPAASDWGAVLWLEAAAGAVFGGAANTNADAGKPPPVSASAAFRA